MRSWKAPHVPRLHTTGTVPRLHDTPSGHLRPLRVDHRAELYVCGITPYDATHLGHAATYLAYDTLNRILRDAGLDVEYVQNVTDIDDPLLERAAATGTGWQDLAETQTELFRGDMEALGIIPPEHYVGVVETMGEISVACARLLDEGYAYWVESGDAGADLYFDLAAAERLTPWHLGQESGMERDTMLVLSAERGGDPERAGKRDPLDPLIWRAERPGEPAWDSPLGRGRPGWHIECSVIGAGLLSAPITLNGGGSDLVFPHHEMSAAHSAALTGRDWAHTYTHAGMVGYAGEKMSKSRGNLVLVSQLTADGEDGRAIRLALLAHHYRTDWEWTDRELAAARQRLRAWSAWAAGAAEHPDHAADAAADSAPDSAGETPGLITQLREHLAEDLDTPAALEAVERRIAAGAPPGPEELDAIDALLGIRL